MAYLERSKRLEYLKLYRVNKKKENIKKLAQKVRSGYVEDSTWVLVMGESYKVSTKNRQNGKN
jgi:hypothetical protein|tara:strand:- start:4 stop:192 length:189 start_codon:yes stop_codon:yes gene_type:complete